MSKVDVTLTWLSRQGTTPSVSRKLTAVMNGTVSVIGSKHWRSLGLLGIVVRVVGEAMIERAVIAIDR